MKLRRKKRAGFSDSSASSDIAFLLIVYFIVIAGFNINKGFMVSLPVKDSAHLVKKENLLRFEIDNDGHILFEGNNVIPAEAERMIQGGIESNPDMAVVLSVYPRAPWQYVVSFVELAQKLKIEAFSFSTREERP